MLKTALKLSAALIVSATPLFAQEYSGQKGLKAIEFLQGWRTPSGTYMTAVRFSLEDGWKTYWRAPGGNGIPPSFTWKGSNNLESVQIHWPSPKLYIQNGVRTIGYKGDFILPIEIMPTNHNQAIKVKSQVDFGICREVCIPVTSRIKTDLSESQTKDTQLIKAALAARPHSAKAGGVKTVTCQVDPTKDGLTITAHIGFAKTAPKVQQAVIEFPHPNIWIEQATLKSSGKSMTAQSELVSYSTQPFFLDRSKLRVTLIGNSRAIEIQGCPAPS